MLASSGLRRRMSRLSTGDGTIEILALDHGLSMGWTENQQSPEEIARSCVELGVRAVVCHVGLLEELSQVPGLELILQLQGSTRIGGDKVPVSVPSLALAADCAAVAVEFDATGKSASLGGTASLINDSHQAGLPVLTMVKYDSSSLNAVSTAIVGAGQLGGDLIKVGFYGQSFTQRELELLKRVVQASPPCVVAGGESIDILTSSLRIAADSSFQGYCVGRQFFNADTRSARIREAKRAFSRGDG